jgi:hypothetical protein
MLTFRLCRRWLGVRVRPLSVLPVLRVLGRGAGWSGQGTGSERSRVRPVVIVSAQGQVASMIAAIRGPYCTGAATPAGAVAQVLVPQPQRRVIS